METKVDNKKMKVIRRRLGFLNGINVTSNGSKRGFCLAQKDDLNVSLKCFSLNFIDVMVKVSPKDIMWRFIGFYGSPYAHDKNEV